MILYPVPDLRDIMLPRDELDIPDCSSSTLRTARVLVRRLVGGSSGLASFIGVNAVNSRALIKLFSFWL